MKIPKVGSMARWTIKWISRVLLAWMMVFIVYWAYSLPREKFAKADAIAFCATVKVGAPAEGILERAKISGAEEFELKWYPRTDGSRTLSVTYVGAPPFSRHACWIEATSTVSSASYSHMD